MRARSSPERNGLRTTSVAPLASACSTISSGARVDVTSTGKSFQRDSPFMADNVSAPPSSSSCASISSRSGTKSRAASTAAAQLTTLRTS